MHRSQTIVVYKTANIQIESFLSEEYSYTGEKGERRQSKRTVDVIMIMTRERQEPRIETKQTNKGIKESRRAGKPVPVTHGVELESWSRSGSFAFDDALLKLTPEARRSEFGLAD